MDGGISARGVLSARGALHAHGTRAMQDVVILETALIK
jgi:hypothetical protein